MDWIYTLCHVYCLRRCFEKCSKSFVCFSKIFASNQYFQFECKCYVHMQLSGLFPKETYLSFSRVYNVFTHTHKHDSLIVNCKTSKTYSKLVLETIEYNLNFLRTQYIHCEGQVMSDFHDMIYIHSIHCISDKRNMLQCRLI